MTLAGMRDVCWGFGGTPLLDHISFQIEKGERVCLMGRNGVGKSSLLKLLAGEMQPDSGEVWHQQGASVAGLQQEVPPGLKGNIFEVASQGLSGASERRDSEEWSDHVRIETVLSRMHLNPEDRFADLSAGMKRRVLFARAMVAEPDLLLLDEPTNHLDIEAIVWLEDYLLRYSKSLLFVTHDRTLVRKLATRIIEIDRGSLFSYACNYETYLERKENASVAEEKRQTNFDKKLAQEEEWIRRGLKARRTRNEGRVRELEKMREIFRNRKKQMGNARFSIQEAEKSGKLVIEAKNLAHSYEERPILKDFSTLVMRGDRLGIIGPNGAGKSTLLKILLKEMVPEAGTVRHGTRLEAAYFDQLRLGLDEEKTVGENIAEGNDYVTVNRQRRHVISYLKDFLFSAERCRTPVRVLSGGEKNRLMLAKLFTRPANILVMDEPTNDLDAETLELLEELLFQFKGTLLLVSHDRTFLNNVVTGTFAFEGDGKVTAYAGGYDDWLLQRPRPENGSGKAKRKKETASSRPRKSAKLGYREKQELEALPGKIETMESERRSLFDEMADPKFYQKEKEEIALARERLETLEKEIDTAYLRWEILEGKA